MIATCAVAGEAGAVIADVYDLDRCIEAACALGRGEAPEHVRAALEADLEPVCLSTCDNLSDQFRLSPAIQEVSNR